MLAQMAHGGFLALPPQPSDREIPGKYIGESVQQPHVERSGIDRIVRCMHPAIVLAVVVDLVPRAVRSASRRLCSRVGPVERRRLCLGQGSARIQQDPRRRQEQRQSSHPRIGAQRRFGAGYCFDLAWRGKKQISHAAVDPRHSDPQVAPRLVDHNQEIQVAHRRQRRFLPGPAQGRPRDIRMRRESLDDLVQRRATGRRGHGAIAPGRFVFSRCVSRIVSHLGRGAQRLGSTR